MQPAERFSEAWHQSGSGARSCYARSLGITVLCFEPHSLKLYFGVELSPCMQPMQAGATHPCHHGMTWGTCLRVLQILAQLDQCKQFPDFNNYLAFIFANGEGLPVEVCRWRWLCLAARRAAASTWLQHAALPGTCIAPQHGAFCAIRTEM